MPYRGREAGVIAHYAAQGSGGSQLLRQLGSLTQMATLTSTMSAVRVAAHRAPTRSAILASSGTTDVIDARSSRVPPTWQPAFVGAAANGGPG